jgi:ABC-2 type transport system permease protein
VSGEIDSFVQRYRGSPLPVDLAMRMRFNPNLDEVWFGALMGDQQRHDAVDDPHRRRADPRTRARHDRAPARDAGDRRGNHAREGVVDGARGRSGGGRVAELRRAGRAARADSGSVPLFVAGMALHLFATTSMGIFLATLVRSMPQFGMLLVLVLLPLQLLSGGLTPRESMPLAVQDIMLAAPTTHFVELAQRILYRGAGLDAVWMQFRCSRSAAHCSCCR